MKNTADRAVAPSRHRCNRPPRLLATFNEMDAVADTRYLRDKSTVILSRRGINTCYLRDVARPSLTRSRSRRRVLRIRERKTEKEDIKTERERKGLSF